MTLPGGIAGLLARELGPEDEALLQRFLEANPAYKRMVEGADPEPGDAAELLAENPPSDWAWTKVWRIGWCDGSGAIAAYAEIVSDLLAPAVWHLGLLMLAQDRWGRGEGRAVYQALEDWARESGAAWIRLGVVAVNARGRAFWQRCGYVQTRTREGTYGSLPQLTLVLCKPLRGGSIATYLDLVPRDRPE